MPSRLCLPGEGEVAVATCIEPSVGDVFEALNQNCYGPDNDDDEDDDDDGADDGGSMFLKAASVRSSSLLWVRKGIRCSLRLL